MKLNQIGLILEAADLSLFNRPYLREYKDMFIASMDWLVNCKPGTAAVDIRTVEDLNGSSASDIRYFAMDTGNPALARIIGWKNSDQIFSLDDNIFSKKIFFTVKNLKSICVDSRLSFDWVHPSRSEVEDSYDPEAMLQSMLDKNSFPFVRKDRFFMFPVKRKKS